MEKKSRVTKQGSKRPSDSGIAPAKPEKAAAGDFRRAWLQENVYKVLVHTIGDLDEMEELLTATQVGSIENREHLSFVMLTVPGLSHQVCSVVSFADPADPLVVAGYVYKQEDKWTLTFYTDERDKADLPDSYSPG